MIFCKLYTGSGIEFFRFRESGHKDTVSVENLPPIIIGICHIDKVIIYGDVCRVIKLAISYSSTDYVGHQFGVNSVEIEDTYLRLDRELKRLFERLDREVGKDNYTVFLTADHGAIHVPKYLADNGMPAGYLQGSAFAKAVQDSLSSRLGVENLIERSYGQNIYLDHQVLRANDLYNVEVERVLAQIFQDHPDVLQAFTRTDLIAGSYSSGLGLLVQNGFHAERSGDIVVVLKPGTVSYPEYGSTHGSPMVYDTHVPLLFMGNGINQGHTFSRTEIIDIAPTVSSLLGIAFPNACMGDPIAEVLSK